MTAPDHLGTVEYEAEASWGENAAISSPTRLLTLGAVDLSGLTWDKTDLGITAQYRNEGWHHVRGPMGGSFTLRHPLHGHGAATTGALTAKALATYLGIVIGNVNTAHSGTTVSDVAATASGFTVTSSTGMASGHMFRVGELGDGAAEGQAFVLRGKSTNDLTLETALPAAPADSDVVYAMQVVHPHEGSSSGSTLTGYRFQLYTGDLQVLCHGCYPQSISIRNLGTGQLPEVEVTWGVSWFEYKASAFPVATTVQTYAPPNVGAGSFFYNVTGTQTRQTLDIRNFELNLELDVVPLMGPGGANTHQAIVGAVRRRCGANFSFTVDSEAATASPVWSGIYDNNENSASFYQFLYTLSVVDGSALALYFPAAVLTSPYPSQQNADGQHRITTSWQARTNTNQSTATTDLWLSAFRLGLG